MSNQMVEKLDGRPPRLADHPPKLADHPPRLGNDAVTTRTAAPAGTTRPGLY
jgi:hypothetical protein